MRNTAFVRFTKIERWELVAIPIVPALFAVVQLHMEMSLLSLLARVLAVWAIWSALVARSQREWASSVHLSVGALLVSGMYLGRQTELIIAVFLETLLSIGLTEGWWASASRGKQLLTDAAAPPAS